MSSVAPRISPLNRSSYATPLCYSPADFAREDERPDAEFYSAPRFVHHIDDGAIAKLKKYYGEVIRDANAHAGDSRDGCRVLDLCSSWTSHLPGSLARSGASNGAGSDGMQRCFGVGLNANELEQNPHLSAWSVRDLNEKPSLRFEQKGMEGIDDESVDLVICIVSIDYLTKPVEVLAEVRRVLRPGGTCHLAFSNRCFPTKVIGRWLGMSDGERRRWVGGYFWADNETGVNPRLRKWEDVEEVVLSEQGWRDPLFVVRARKSEGGRGEKSGDDLSEI